MRSSRWIHSALRSSTFLIAVLGTIVSFGTIAEAQVCAGGDTTSPLLTITSPLRSDAITQGGAADDIVVVMGSATDVDSTLASITVNGVEALVGQGGMFEPFSVNTTSRWGLNTIVAIATDDCGNEHEVVQSYTRGGAYFGAAIAEDPAAEAPTGHQTQLNQNAVDDSDRGSLDDMATSMEGAILPVPSSAIPSTIKAAVNPPCNGILDNWVVGQNRVRVTKQSFAMADLVVDSVDAVDDKQIGTATSNSFVLGFKARAYNCVAGNLLFVDRTGTLTSNNVQVTFDIVPSAQNGEFASTIENVVPTMTFNVTVDCALQVICNAMTNLVVPLIGTDLKQGVKDRILDATVTTRVVAFLEHAIPIARSWTGVAYQRLTPVLLNVRRKVDSVLKRQGKILSKVGIQVHPASRGASIPPAAPGSIRRDGLDAAFALVPYDQESAVHDDMVNQLLWSFWYGGALDVPDLTALAAEVGLALTSLSHVAHLPPVLMPGGAPNRVEIGFGDVEFSLVGDLDDLLGPPHSGPLIVTGYWSSVLGGAMAADPEGKRLDFIPDASDAIVEITTLNHALLKSKIVPALEAKFAALEVKIARAMLSHFKLPRTPLAALGGSSVFELSIANAIADRPGDSATRLTGDFAESAICGDQFIVGIETCDDGNDFSHDGCSASCQVEIAQACVGTPSVCTSTCGDGVVDAAASETCDDMNTANGDGCSSTCQLETDHTFVGTAAGGGEVSVTVDGQLIVVATAAGEPAAVIAQRLAQAINWNTSVVALASAGQLIVEGELSSVVIDDPGLMPAPVPAIGLFGRLALVALLGASIRSRRTARAIG